MTRILECFCDTVSSHRLPTSERRRDLGHIWRRLLICAACVEVLSASGVTTESRLPVKPGGVVAILDEPTLPVRGIASSPKVIGKILGKAGIVCQSISARQLADPVQFTRGLFDLVILPTGQSFPAQARENFVRYLQQGGGFISMGGYAFDHLLWEHDGKWYPCDKLGELKKQFPQAMIPAAVKPLSSARGVPRNELTLASDQIGIFDACFSLKRVCKLATSPNQALLRKHVKLEGELTGWATSGTEGDFKNNGVAVLRAEIKTNARWIPILETYDCYGRTRGAAGAVLLNFNGFYAGSNWGYFGVENVDLFKDSGAPAAVALQAMARFLIRGVYLRQVTVPQRLLHVGEPIVAEAIVENCGAKARHVSVCFALSPDTRTSHLRPTNRELTIEPGQNARVQVRLGVADEKTDLGTIVTTLKIDDKPIDEISTGYVVERKAILQTAPRLDFKQNYFTYGNRSMFLFGSDETAYVYLTPHENPLTWSRDLLAARDIGMNLYENLQYSRPGYQMTDSDWRNIKAMGQLTQKYGLVFMPGMHIVRDVSVTDSKLAQQCLQTRGYAEILNQLPASLCYINGDYAYSPFKTLTAKEYRMRWNAWLRQRYGSTEKLQAVWRQPVTGLEKNEVEVPTKASKDWDDPVVMDLIRFSAWLTLHWNNAHVDAVRAIDQQHPITSEYFPNPHSGIHLRMTLGKQTVANVAAWSEATLSTALRWNDMRYCGKGVSLGEYGMQAHPAWTREGGPSREGGMPQTEMRQSRLFTGMAHLALGMGAAKIQNWCLRDGQHRSVHPWGIYYASGMVPKDVAYIHRNLSLLWRHLAPRYAQPSLAVCIPINHGMGNQKQLGVGVPARTFETLMKAYQDGIVFDDYHLEKLDSSTKLLIYPSPFAVTDESYKRLRAWVRAGGTLLVTGDFSYDEQRQRNRKARFPELAGVEFLDECYPNITRDNASALAVDISWHGIGSLNLKPCVRVKAAGADVLGATKEGDPVFVRHRLGAGSVFYVTDPLELSSNPTVDEARMRIYQGVLQEVGIKPLTVETEPALAASLNVFAQPTAQGTAHVLFNRQDTNTSTIVSVPTAAGKLALSVRPGWPAMAEVTTSGRLVAMITDGTAAIGTQRILQGSGMKGMLSLDGDDLRQSHAFVVAPWEAGECYFAGADSPASAGSSVRHWAKPVAVVGEFRNGEWMTLERVSLDAKELRVTINADQATCLILVCEAREAARWQQQLTDAMLHPERIQAY